MYIARPLIIAALTALPLRAEAQAEHGISLYDELKYGPDFTHFDYTTPDAP